MLRHFVVYFQRLSIVAGGSTQHTRDMKRRSLSARVAASDARVKRAVARTAAKLRKENGPLREYTPDQWARMPPVLRRAANRLRELRGLPVIPPPAVDRSPVLPPVPTNDDAEFMALVKAPGHDHEAMAKALERTLDLIKRRMLRSDELHAFIRKFVAAYIATADAENFDGDIEPGEREDLRRGARLKTSLREKWAVLRAAEYFGRDERTIREAVKPSRRSRRSRRRHRT
jgi:hypothetical protein